MAKLRSALPKKRTKRPTCRQADTFPCGYSCQNQFYREKASGQMRETQCKNILKGQVKDFMTWQSTQAKKIDEINAKRRKAGLADVVTTDALMIDQAKTQKLLKGKAKATPTDATPVKATTKTAPKAQASGSFSPAIPDQLTEGDTVFFNLRKNSKRPTGGKLLSLDLAKGKATIEYKQVGNGKTVTATRPVSGLLTAEKLGGEKKGDRQPSQSIDPKSESNLIGQGEKISQDVFTRIFNGVGGTSSERIRSVTDEDMSFIRKLIVDGAIGDHAQLLVREKLTERLEDRLTNNIKYTEKQHRAFPDGESRWVTEKGYKNLKQKIDAEGGVYYVYGENGKFKKARIEKVGKGLGHGPRVSVKKEGPTGKFLMENLLTGEKKWVSDDFIFSPKTPPEVLKNIEEKRKLRSELKSLSTSVSKAIEQSQKNMGNQEFQSYLQEYKKYTDGAKESLSAKSQPTTAIDPKTGAKLSQKVEPSGGKGEDGDRQPQKSPEDKLDEYLAYIPEAKKELPKGKRDKFGRTPVTVYGNYAIGGSQGVWKVFDVSTRSPIIDRLLNKEDALLAATGLRRAFGDKKYTEMESESGLPQREFYGAYDQKVDEIQHAVQSRDVDALKAIAKFAPNPTKQPETQTIDPKTGAKLSQKAEPSQAKADVDGDRLQAILKKQPHEMTKDEFDYAKKEVLRRMDSTSFKSSDATRAMDELEKETRQKLKSLGVETYKGSQYSSQGNTYAYAGQGIYYPRSIPAKVRPQVEAIVDGLKSKEQQINEKLKQSKDSLGLPPIAFEIITPGKTHSGYVYEHQQKTKTIGDRRSEKPNPSAATIETTGYNRFNSKGDRQFAIEFDNVPANVSKGFFTAPEIAKDYPEAIPMVKKAIADEKARQAKLGKPDWQLTNKDGKPTDLSALGESGDRQAGKQQPDKTNTGYRAINDDEFKSIKVNDTVTLSRKQGSGTIYVSGQVLSKSATGVEVKTVNNRGGEVQRKVPKSNLFKAVEKTANEVQAKAKLATKPEPSPSVDPKTGAKLSQPTTDPDSIYRRDYSQFEDTEAYRKQGFLDGMAVEPWVQAGKPNTKELANKTGFEVIGQVSMKGIKDSPIEQIASGLVLAKGKMGTSELTHINGLKGGEVVGLLDKIAKDLQYKDYSVSSIRESLKGIVQSSPAPKAGKKTSQSTPAAPEQFGDRQVASPQTKASPATNKFEMYPLKGEKIVEKSVSVKGSTSPKPFEPNYLGRIPTDSINFDPQRFQYKVVHGETGSSGSLTGVKKWNEAASGVLMVWKDPDDGKTYIVNGHNRATLAKNLGVETLPVKFIDAKNANEARAAGAIANIAEGRGNPIDAAKFFRDSKMSRQDLEDLGIPMKESIAVKGMALANLPEHLFMQVYMGSMSVERAVQIGCCGLSHSQQDSLAKMIESQERKGRNVTNAMVSELVDTVKSAETVQTQTLDLFGNSTDEQSLAIEVAGLQAFVKRKLGRDKKLFGTVSKSTAAKDLQRAGNEIKIEDSAKIAKEADIGLTTFEQFKNLTSPVTQVLNEGARRIINGEPRKKVEQETYEKIAEVLPTLLPGGEKTGSGDRQGFSGGSGRNEPDNQISLFSESQRANQTLNFSQPRRTIFKRPNPRIERMRQKREQHKRLMGRV